MERNLDNSHISIAVPPDLETPLRLFLSERAVNFSKWIRRLVLNNLQAAKVIDSEGNVLEPWLSIESRGEKRVEKQSYKQPKPLSKIWGFTARMPFEITTALDNYAHGNHETAKNKSALLAFWMKQELINEGFIKLTQPIGRQVGRKTVAA